MTFGDAVVIVWLGHFGAAYLIVLAIVQADKATRGRRLSPWRREPDLCGNTPPAF